MTKRSMMAFAIAGHLALAASVGAKIWHVSPDGKATAGSAVTLPVATGAAMPGDTVWLHEGTYRETLRPSRSGTPDAPITFLAFPGEAPLLTGLDSIGGWSQGPDGIWSAPVSQEVRQLFQGRAPMPEARFPNTGRDLFRPATIPLTMKSPTLASKSFPKLDSSWIGATVWAMIGLRWVSQCATVTGIVSGSLTLEGNSYADNAGDGIGYLCGVRAALDTAGEWLWKDDSLLFLPDAEKTPSQVPIEGKTRTWAIDLSSRTDIVVQGLRVFAGAAKLNRSKRCRLEGLSMRYLSHYITPVGAATTSSWTRHEWTDINYPGIGIGIFGDSNVVRGCDLQWSAGDGITLYGNGNLAEGNTISQVDYAGSDANGISIHGTGSRITRNTVDSCGRGCIYLSKGTAATRIDHNHVFRPGRVNWDVGGIYSYGNDGQGSSIDHNWVHDSRSSDPSKLGMGIYIDNFCSNTSVHHNVIWDCDHNALNYSRPSVNITWANNTVFNAANVTFSYLHPDATTDSSRDNRLWNNLMTTSYSTNGTFEALDQSHNLKLAALPLQDPSHFDFRPVAGSAAIDAGITIQDLDDPITGKPPDAGAYEFGGVFWKAGAGSVDSGVSVSIATAPRAQPASWRIEAHAVVAAAPCVLRLSDLSGRQFGRVRMQAGERLELEGLGSRTVLISDGRTTRSLFLGH